jgi:hypothetical protein
MGQANLRGTEDQRIEQGILKREMRIEARRIERANYEANLTPEQRKSRQKALTLLAIGSAISF